MVRSLFKVAGQLLGFVSELRESTYSTALELTRGLIHEPAYADIAIAASTTNTRARIVLGSLVRKSFE